jgi:hypothetical protein
MVRLIYVHPNQCIPPHKVTHEEKLEKLIHSIQNNGWDGPSLLGYVLDDKIQLISGSHRWAAMDFLDFLIPVDLKDFSYVHCVYGTKEWEDLMISANPIKLSLQNMYDMRAQQ